MRNSTSIISALLICFILSSCSSNHSGDVYFLHTAVFGKTETGKLQITAILEKLSSDDKKDNYFTVVENGKDIAEITGKISDTYKECYFATSEVYAFDSSLSSEDLKVIARAICDSNDYPSKSLAYYFNGTDTKSFCELIKSDDDMKKLLSELSDKKVNVIHFLCSIYNGTKTELPSLTIRDGRIKRTDNKIFNKR